MKLLLATIVIGLSLNTFSFDKERFCDKRAQPDFALESLLDTPSRISFRNQGGIANGGVCWWHSRFQRNAAYLVQFEPSKPAPTPREAKKIIDKIRKGKEVVEIPGYRSLFEFSIDYKKQIIKELEAWQRTDGFINQAWIQGLRGKSKVEASKLHDMMDELYESASNNEIVFQVLQIKGITAHAWLVIGMDKFEDGYNLKVIDSNFPAETQVYSYKVGMESLYSKYYGEFVSYTYKEKEEDRLKSIVSRICE